MGSAPVDMGGSSAVRRVSRRAVVGAALVLGLLFTAGPASAVRPVPELVASASSVPAGASVSFTGRGFFVPPVESCEVRSSAAVESGCNLDDHAFGSVLLAENLSPGTYEVLVCAPTCTSPWAGSASGELTVESSGEPVALAALVVVDGVELTPTSAAAGDEVFVEAASVPTVTGDCVAQWAGEEESDATCALDGNGVVSGVITAPDAEETAERRLVVCWPDCGDPVGGTATTAVTVETGAVENDTVTGSPTTGTSNRPTDPGGTGQSTAPVAVDVVDGGNRTTTVLLILVLVVLLALAVAMARWRLRRSPPLPTLRVIADPQPSLVVTLLRPRLTAPTVRVRGVPDQAPTIMLEVRR